MSISRNIVATYRGPGAVIKRLLDMGQREDRALAYVMGACVLFFVAQLPRLAREAHLTGQDLDMLMGGSLMAWIFIAPLLFYAIAFLARVVGHLRVARAGQRLWRAPVALLGIAGLVAAGPAAAG